MEFFDLAITTVITIISFIAGGILGYFFLLKSTQKRIEYELIQYELIPQFITEDLAFNPDFIISFQSNPISCLTSTIIKIENTGYNAISGINDISPNDLIRITSPEGIQIFDALLLKSHGSDIQFKREIEENRIVKLHFHHLNPGDGVKINIFHSGNQETEIQISGTVIGGPKISHKPKWRLNLMDKVSMFIGVIVSTVILILNFLFLNHNIFANIFAAILVLFAICFIWAMLAALIAVSIETVFKYTLSKIGIIDW
jgi:hypothetical protein